MRLSVQLKEAHLWPVSATTLGEACEWVAERKPDRPALVCGQHSVTFAELLGAVRAVAGGLAELGVAPGDRVGLMMPNCPQFVITYLGITYLGATVVPIPSLLGVEEAAYILADSGARVVVAHDALAEVARGAAAQAGVATLITTGEPANSSEFTLQQAMAMGAPAAAAAQMPADAPAVLIFTSGTTGKPKGAILTHGNLLANCDSCRCAIRVSGEDTFVSILPFFHSYGATVSMLLPLFCGSKNVLMPQFLALETLQAVQAHRATIVAGVPTMYAVMLQIKEPGALDVSSLRFVVSGGAALPTEVCLGFERAFGVPIVEGYGPTEASPVVSCNPTDGSRKIGSVGPPLPGVEVMIADDDMNALALGQIGEICVRGPNVMTGYHNASELTAQTIVDGWLRTGDLGRLDEDGHLYIVDRKKDMVIVGGINVYPREVEECIQRMHSVAEVAVVGKPSRLRGEVVAAYVVPTEGLECSAQQVISHCREHLAPYKVPKQVYFIDGLPKSAIGKVLKGQLRALQV
jgi:long-chain acyl-CoA synthetase